MLFAGPLHQTLALTELFPLLRSLNALNSTVNLLSLQLTDSYCPFVYGLFVFEGLQLLAVLG